MQPRMLRDIRLAEAERGADRWTDADRRRPSAPPVPLARPRYRIVISAVSTQSACGGERRAPHPSSGRDGVESIEPPYG